MEALGRLAGGIAHDFNNMLSVILSATGLASRRSDRESVKRDLAQISQAALRAAELSRQLLAFSRRQVLEPRHVSLDEIVRHTEPMLRRLLGEDIRIVTSLATGAERVLVDPGKMEQVLVNLAVNARDAMPAGGTLQIATRRVTLAAGEARELGGATAGEWLVLAVADEGVGIDPETQAHIFEPFFTTKPDGRGTGLGLSTVFGIVSQSGGYITVDSEPGRGACFSIYLPPTEDPVDFETSEPAPESAGGSEIVLVVEDDPLVRRAALRVLQSKGYAVLDAASAEEALALLGDHEGPVDLLLTDLVLPGMNGLDLARQLLRERPALKVVCMTGYVGRDFGSGVPAEEDIEFINKPFDHEGLANKVRSVLDR
jgi:CheY-like chemotaxis protein